MKILSIRLRIIPFAMSIVLMASIVAGVVHTPSVHAASMDEQPFCVPTPLPQRIASDSDLSPTICEDQPRPLQNKTTLLEHAQDTLNFYAKSYELNCNVVAVGVDNENNGYPLHVKLIAACVRQKTWFDDNQQMPPGSMSSLDSDIDGVGNLAMVSGDPAINVDDLNSCSDPNGCANPDNSNPVYTTNDA